MPSFDRNPYSALDEVDSTEEISEDEYSVYSHDAELEWEETKEQMSALFSMVIFPYVGKWLGRKVSYWIWSKYMLKSPISSHYLTDTGVSSIFSTKSGYNILDSIQKSLMTKG
ncbi:hypothetical protein BDB01DRAFT_835424 [Pilobolus umbonatus]|nr:hypothetical protein BDB01DRAFT_835424 [Pilobolus umbonatus]